MKAWFAAHKVSAKTFALVWLFLVGLWASNADFRTYVLDVYAALPVGLHRFIAGIVIPVLVFWKTQRSTLVSVEPGDNADVKVQTSALPVLVFCMLAVGLLVPATVHAQSVQNLYAAGVSYSPGASPSVAGTALYAHQVSADTAPGMYAFTAVDILPNTVKPLTVSTNIAVGVAQKLFTVGKYSVYTPLAAGFSVTGTNAGWNWSTGGCADVPLKGSYGLMPCVRVLKNNVGNGTGYQLIPGVLFRIGK